MNNRTFLIYGVVFLLLVSFQVAVLLFQRSPDSAGIECRARNAGLPLDREQGRVHVYPASRPDQLVAEGRLHETLELPPGSYDARVVLAGTHDQHAVWLDGITLAPGERVVREVSFAAGELSVEAMVGPASAEVGRVVVYVFRSDDHDRVVTSMHPAERVLIAAGSYDLRVVLTVDSEEKDVRWLHDVEVKAGVHTQRDVAFERGTLRVKATNAGQPLPAGAVTLTIYRAGDVQNEEVDSGGTDVPLGLAVGSYDVKVTYTASNDRSSRWLRALEIRESETLERTVDFASGTFVVNAEIENGDAVGDFAAYVYYYRRGDHREAVAYAPAGRAVVLESGRYDVRASFFRSHDQPDLWLRDVTLEPGRIVTKTARFPSGRLLVRAYEASGTELTGDNVFVHLYASGHRLRPIAVGRSGEILTLTEGEYDLRVEDTRQPGREEWLGDVRLRSGELREESVTFEGGSAGDE